MCSLFPVQVVDCCGNDFLPEAVQVMTGEKTWGTFLDAVGVEERDAWDLFPWQLHPDYEDPMCSDEELKDF